jgi:hypothetical protein
VNGLIPAWLAFWGILLATLIGARLGFFLSGPLLAGRLILRSRLASGLTLRSRFSRGMLVGDGWNRGRRTKTQWQKIKIDLAGASKHHASRVYGSCHGERGIRQRRING